MALTKTLINYLWLTCLYCLASFVVIFTLSIIIEGQIPINSDSPFISCEFSNQRIAVNVTAKVFNNGGQKKHTWLIKNLPGESDIVIDDPNLREQILKTISQLTPLEDTFNVKFTTSGEGSSTGLFHRVLESFTRDIDQYDLSIEAPKGIEQNLPSDDEVANNTKKIIVLCVDYVIPPKTESPETELEILLSTATDEKNSSPIVTRSKLADFDADLNGKPAGESNVSFIFYQRDVTDAGQDGSVKNVQKRVEEELQNVVQKALNAAKPVIISGGKILPCSDAKRTEFSAAVKSALSIYKLDLDGRIKWNILTVRARCESSSSRDKWKIQVEGLRITRGIFIEVAEEDWEKEQSGTIAGKLKNNRQRTQKKFQKKFSTALKAKAGRILTRDQIDEDTDEKISPLMSDVKQILAPTSESVNLSAQTASSNDSILYYPVYRKTLELDMTLKLKGSYSKESSLTGLLATDFLNLLNLRETISLSAEAGNEVQKYLFSFSKPFDDKESETARFELKSLSADIKVFKDKNQRLSNLTPDQIALRETGSNIRLSFGYDSFTSADRLISDCLTFKDRKRNRYGILMDVSGNYKDVNIKNDDLLLRVTGIDKSLLPSSRTQTAKATFGINGFYSHDFRTLSKAGLGNFNASLKSVFEKGTRTLGADYNYTKAGSVFQTELLFGWLTATDIFIRYRQGVNINSRETPVFELNRLGGSDNVRGIEEGERIGRKIHFSQVDLGISSLTLLRLLQGKNKVIGNEEFCLSDSTAAEPKFEDFFSKIYLKVFYDFGRIKDGTSYTIDPNFKQSAQGFGMAAELRRLARDQNGNNINLSIGYAYSSKSRLHRRGLLFVGIGYEF